jgi:hypothetical protein
MWMDFAQEFILIIQFIWGSRTHKANQLQKIYTDIDMDMYTQVYLYIHIYDYLQGGRCGDGRESTQGNLLM